ncbi:MAG: type II secretion system GspH family protein [Paraglaciecola sp.]|nr:type II secretion system GspH family protein [Paraglaciecola sp.]
MGPKPRAGQQRGFSLVELITVVILIGVLSVFVGSRFIGGNGFAEYVYQAKVIAVLRVMQTRAMHDTRPGYCFQVNFDSSPSSFGPPSLNYTGGASSDTCSTIIDTSNPDNLFTSDAEMLANNVSFSAVTDGSVPLDFIGFDNLGRPLTAETNCAAGCKIDVLGEKTVSVCVEAQGYVHAC